MQIIILGMHRSGTSTVTRLVNMMGAYFGEDGEALVPNEANPKGYWELREVMDCNEVILAECGAFWDASSSWNPDTELSEKTTQRMQSIVDRMDAHVPWVMKDPRMCLTLPKWKPLLQKPVVVIVYRDPLEIVESLHVRDNIPVVVGISLWEQYIASALSAAMDMPRIFVHYSEIMSNPVHATQRIYNELVYNGVTGLSMPSEEVITDFVDPALYRSKPMVAKDLQLTMFQETLKACASGQASLFSKVEKTPVSHAYLEIYKYIHADRETIKKLREDIRDANFKITASEQHVLELKNSLQKAKDAGDELSKKLSESEQYLHDANTLIQKQNERLNYIYTTLWWKLGSGIAKVLRAARLR